MTAPVRRLNKNRKRDYVSMFAYIGVAVCLVADSARGDSTVGTNGAVGNQLNPSGLPSGLVVDVRGMSRIVEYARSPTGLLYPKPFMRPSMSKRAENSNWWHAAWAEVGFLAAPKQINVASFTEYGDWNGGAVANFGFLAENRENANYVSGRAGSIGRSDQFYDLQFGRYGLLKIDLYFRATPHLLATNAKVLWNGAGTDSLTLPPALAPGAVSSTALQNAYAATPTSKLSLTRSKAGMNAVYQVTDVWEVYFNLSSEWRDGKTSIGSAFSFPGRGAAELVQPIDYRTVEVATGIRFKGETAQANMAYAGSFFRNEFTALTWDNPALGLPPGSFVPQKGRLALSPDNDFHTLKGDFAWALPDVRLVASGSYSTMRQNEALLPPTINAGLAPIDLARWNTLSALSRSSANARIENVDGLLQLHASATDTLGFTLEARYRDENNKTSYLAYNPVTGEYGYMGLDGALSRIYNPSLPGSDVPIRNIAFATDRLELAAKVDYRLAARTRLNLALTHKEADRAYREVSHSNDNGVEVQLASSGHEWGTVRASYELADRSSSLYVADPYMFARSVSLPGYLPRVGGDIPYALASLHKYDVGDRIEHAVKLQTNFVLSQKTDFQVSGGFEHSDYDANYGLRNVESYDVNASVATQLSDSTTLSAFYGFQSHSRAVASINVVRTASGDNTAGGPNYPIANNWNETANDANHTVGATVQTKIDTVTIDLNYTYTFANSAFSYLYAGPGAIGATLTPASAGTALPDQRYANNVFEANVIWPYDERIVVRGYYRLEYEDLSDFHYDGMTNVVANHLFLATVPQGYTAHILGVFTQWRF